MKKPKAKINPRNEKPISLHPLTLEEALRGAMSVKPPSDPKKQSQKRKRGD
jgi:hypothetical protein